MHIERIIEEMRSRMPWIRWRVMEPEEVDPFLGKLGYDRWYDRCKYDVITFHENGRERAALIWNLVSGPDRERPARSWERQRESAGADAAGS